jgi:magnesium transporter
MTQQINKPRRAQNDDKQSQEAGGVFVLTYRAREPLVWALRKPTELTAIVKSEEPSWFRIDDVGDRNLLQEVGRAFGLHELVLEDVANTRQRPKLDVYDGYVFIALRLLRFRRDNLSIRGRQLSLIIGPHYVVTFHEGGAEEFVSPIVERQNHFGGRSDKTGSAFMAYTILDAVVDEYSHIGEAAADIFEEMEDKLLNAAGRDSLRLLYRLKRINLTLRRAVWPLREVVGPVGRECLAEFSGPIAPYLRDVEDHVLHLMEVTDSLRETHVMLLDIHLSSVSNRLNEVMKFLTLIATVFIPLTFIAGVYGMNFKHMPELEWAWGYPACLSLMAIVGGALVALFWKKGWL